MASTDPAAQESAANDFAAKFPDSEGRVSLYEAAMHSYQVANNTDKMLEMARKALAIDPDDPEALVAAAQVLAERTRLTDVDKDQRLAEAKKDVQRAMVTIDIDVSWTGYPPEQVSAYKAYYRSVAYAILGDLAYDAKDWPDAEMNLRSRLTRIRSSQIRPHSSGWLSLWTCRTITQRHWGTPIGQLS